MPHVIPRSSGEDGAAEPDVNQLLSQAIQGSKSKLGLVLERYRPYLTKLAQKRVGVSLRRRMSISDLVQETIITASLQFAQFRGKTENELSNWLTDVLRSRLVDGLRRHRLAERRRQSLEVSVSDSKFVCVVPSADQQVADVEQAGVLLNALQTLPEELQQIVRLRYIENKTFEAIAAETNSSVTTVWRRWSEALQLLKSKLQ